MSTLISDNIQLGQNVDSTKNFTLQNPDNGTAVFSTGNSGNTLYDVFIIQSDGTAHFSGATFFNGNATFNSYAIFTGAVSAPTFNGSIVGGTGSFTTLTTSGDATINGNLIVVGDTVTVDTQTLIVEDNNITLGNVATPSNVTATGGGITVLGDTSKTFNWESPSAGWTSSEYITAPGFLGTASNVVTNANLTGDVTSIGNATTLATVNPNTGSFGSSSSVPVITVNGKGLVTSVTTSAISSTISVTGGDLTLSGTTGVDITNATLATVNANVGIFGDTTHVPQIIVDGKGRVTSAGNIAINTMVYPGAGFAHSTGTAWDTSYSSTGTGNVVLSSGATIATPTITTPTISNPTVSGAITGGFNGAVTTLAVASNAVAVDLSVNNNFAVTLQATTTQTLSNPINAVAGQSGQISITQNATPSVLNFGANWESINGSTTVNSTAGSVTLLTYYVVDSTHIWFGLGTGTSIASGGSFNQGVAFAFSARHG